MIRNLFFCLAATRLLTGPISAEELPALIKPTAEQFDRSMKEYDVALETQMKVAKDRYVALLEVARKREAGAKRPAAVAAIDEELKAAATGMVPEKAPANFPSDLGIYRTDFFRAGDRAQKSVASARKFSQESYLKWLAGMVDVARRGKDPALEAAALGEEKRVRATMPKEEEKTEADPAKEPAKAPPGGDPKAKAP